MLKLAICDDEETMVLNLKERITDYLIKHSYQFQIDTFQNAGSLLLKETHYDIIFLDIQMKGISGMEAAQKLRKSGKNSYIVFVTISPEYVYDAFEVEASDYILKPISPQRFYRTMERILHYLNEQKSKYLSIQKGSYCQFIGFDHILYCEIINRIIYVHTKDEVIDYYCKINELEIQLDPCFFRCHRSYLVNLRYVCSYEKGMAHLENGEQIPISRLRQQEFLSAMLLYMKGR